MVKEFYSEFLKDESWLIKEDKFVRELQNIREAQFSQGNGYLGVRGVLEEIPYDSQPGTYLAGLYDRLGSQVAELVNLPNPINFRFTIEGEKIDLVAMSYLEHRRILNLKYGVLVRHSLYRDAKGRIYDYQSLRFISMACKNIGVLQVVFSPLTSAVTLDVNTGIDTAVFNASVLSEGRKKHFRVRELGQAHQAGYLVIETLERKHPVVFWSGFYYEKGRKKIYQKDNIFRLRVNKGETVVFTKIFCIKRFPYKEDHFSFKKETFKIFNKAFKSKFSTLLYSHTKAWERLWKRADIIVEGAANDFQTNLRFNIYHLLSCANYDYGFSSIGARTLSGEGYRGHVFWDTEIFLMPFYILNFPQVAKNLLLYRYRRLDKARQLAKSKGFKGAKFPWESAYTGEEETPSWAKDFDGRVIKIYTHKLEEHISADIAYGVYRYYQWTKDEKFMEYCGYEMLFEIAKFWASRLEYNQKEDKFEINQVIGPDEFHIAVNNNAYTNMLAKWVLVTAYKSFILLKERRKSLLSELKKKISLKDKEVTSWRKIASKIKVNINKEGLIEQFDGYFKLKKILPTQTDEYGLPLIPANLKSKDLKHTQIIKQADVLMLIYLLDEYFSYKSKLVNYHFYLPRTVHKSSLSPAIHSILASWMRDLPRAYNFFNFSLRIDIGNLYGNTSEGIHSASLGGTWQAVIFGFSGLKLRQERLYIEPRLPYRWKSVSFSFLYRQKNIRVKVSNSLVEFKFSTKEKKSLEVIVFGKSHRLKPNRKYIFERKSVYSRKEAHY